uniref:Peptidase M13 C-terminal domain-containing protein n=1 Tax=Glossina brevipalpis TaxID=37001 RepID=A0A1A9W8G8_9MUSC
MLISSMDINGDPCEDFYQYACGKWGTFHAVENKYHEAISLVDYFTNKEIGRYLKFMNRENKPNFLLKAHDYYLSCRNLEVYEPLEYLRRLSFYENLSIWPNHRRRHEVNFDWLRTLAIMRKYGLNGIFIEEITLQRNDDATVTIIDLDKPVKNGGFELTDYDDLKLLIQTLRRPMRRKIFKELWNQINAFEFRLKNLDLLDDPEGNTLIKVKDLSMPWLKRYLELIIDRLDPEMEISIQNKPYLHKVFKLINEYEPRFICKYLELTFLWHLNIEGPPNFTLEDCAGSTRTLMPYAMHWLFEQMHPELVTEMAEIHKMFQQLINHFSESLKNNTNSFNDNQLEFLLNKLSNIQLKVGNLPRINTEEKLNDFYKDLVVNPFDFYGNHLKLLKFNTETMHKRLNYRIPRNADEFFYLEGSEIGFSSSPYFEQRANVVIVPVTSLQLPIYHPELDDIFKYSSLGFLLAHEIIHGFDYTGLGVDYNGNLNNLQFEGLVNNTHFKRKMHCLRYLNPTIIDEKIADVSGLRLAYETYFKLHPEAREQSRYMYGRPQNVQRIFFLNFAQFFCGPLSNTLVDIKEHGSDRDRVLEAIKHFEEFSAVYSCPQKSAMRLEKTCQLWRR